MRFSITRLVPVVALVAAGCGGNTLGQLGDILGQAAGAPSGAGQTGQVTVEVRGVDTQRQLIQVVTQEGQTGNVRYDDRTVVVYRQQQYPVTALERGDVVVMQIQDVQGTTYTGRIDVQQSVQERTGTTSGAGNIMQLSGRIGQIDHNRGWFVLQLSTGENVTVTLPYNPPQATLVYFHRLRTGHTVRLEATAVGNNRVEIYRFL